MKKNIYTILVSVIFLGVLGVSVNAQTTDSSVQDLIQRLQQQVEQLKSQIQSLQQAQNQVAETSREVRSTLRLIRQLREGMTGEDVELLQEILATDPDIYPEGLITGYFGQLTRNAVQRFQKVAGIDQVGSVGPQTLSRLNKLLEEGAGKSGRVPPGLLIAPGIRKKVDIEILKPLPGQVLPPGIGRKLDLPGHEDETAPVISNIQVNDIGSTSVKISWTTDEESNSKVWYDTTNPLVVTDSTSSVGSSDLVLNHEIMLSGLTADTAYYFIVSSKDEANNNEISEQEDFSTIP